LDPLQRANQLFLPSLDGQITSLSVSPPRPVCPDLDAKIIRFRFFGIRDLVIPFRAGTRGVRVVTNVGRNAVDVKMLSDVRLFLRTAKSCGPGAPKARR
jgi:hypothetical protein